MAEQYLALSSQQVDPSHIAMRKTLKYVGHTRQEDPEIELWIVTSVSIISSLDVLEPEE